MSNKLAARKDGSNFIASSGPDVCKTSVGSGAQPVPYTSIAFLDTALRVNPTVRRNGKPDFMLNSRTSNSMGTEPGKGKGIKEPGHLGPAAVKKTTGSVFSSGWASARHKDDAVINMTSPGNAEKKRG